MRVTRTPRRANAWAISQPTGPPPRMARDGGAGIWNKVSLVRGPISAKPGIGGTMGREPVATTKRRLRKVRPPTSTRSGAVNRAKPSMTPMPSRARAAASSVAAIRSTAAWTAAMAWAKGAPRAAAARSALEGTQPVKVQSPPTGPSCTMTALAPRRRASRAATSPPAPPPTTTRS